MPGWPRVVVPVAVSLFMGSALAQPLPLRLYATGSLRGAMT